MGKLSVLERHYQQHKEDHRLETRHGQVEFAVSMKFIHDYLPKDRTGCKILDVGAGTGRYSLALCGEGFDVTAVELVKSNLDVLRSKHSPAKTWQGNALDLHFLEDNTFDLTLLFGPLYHLHEKAEKLKALSEAKRVSTPLLFKSLNASKTAECSPRVVTAFPRREKEYTAVLSASVPPEVNIKSY